MYADDLVLVTRASRSAARNIIICLELFGHFSGLHLNKSKSAIYFPSWFNKRVQTSICSILNISSAQFPFKYLGVLISPKRLAASVFDSMVDKIQSSCCCWKHSNLSKAAKAILINSSLLSLPNYYLSVYLIPHSILSAINKISRNFFWHHGGNGKGIHAVAWNNVLDFKSEGGLSIRNLSKVKYSLMAKHVFKYLNKFDAIWVDILHFKYGCINFWTDPTPPRCSTAFALKHHCWIKCVNPTCTSILYDPWCFDVPLAFKHTFINMDGVSNSVNLMDFISHNDWNHTKLQLLFGDSICNISGNLVSIDFTGFNFWVWFPKAHTSKLATNVYKTLNHNADNGNSWIGWHKLWAICSAPRVKYFLWMLFKGRISTFEYLYSIHLGPRNFCSFCGLDYESIEHLFFNCCKTQRIWYSVYALIGKHIDLPGGFSAGNWLTFHSSAFNKFVIVAVAWHIWKARCDWVFRRINPNFGLIACKAICFANDFFQPTALNWGTKLLLNNFTNSDGLFLFIAASLNVHNQVYHVGFFIADFDFNIVIAGSCPLADSTCLVAKLHVLSVALHTAISSGIHISYIFNSNPDILRTITSSDFATTWRMDQQISETLFLLDAASHPLLHIIPHHWLKPASLLATHAANLHTFTLFHVGRELPKWIMRCLLLDGFTF
ncbi:uncharacterized protein LOC120265002 [Dioscorea cayenensis subsp. rotundata]|uniref:Uncharacterized protein LOC120265002 n=1 Tax=Dioscorea cayennensis subsp. rotundata TaxID=55577 RepID=A0AB40BNJ8_DIOCR|nr:uncharacterized protein LOC120265002 [Dioscorea cayenensis subsp. rotundata]